MKLLYSGLDELLRGVQKAVPKLTEYPVISDMTTTMIYLGPLTDLAEVEVKKDKNSKGWMYNINSIIFFHIGYVLYEVFISTLRELAEEKLAAKKLIKEEETPSAGVMKRGPSGQIIGFIAVEDLVKVSNNMNRLTSKPQEDCHT